MIYPKRFDEFIIIPGSNKYFLVKGKNDELNHPFNILLLIVQIVVFSLFIYLFFEERTNSDPFLFIQIVLVYSVFIIVKMLFEKIVGALFSIEKLINNYLYHKLTYLNLFSLLLFIVNVLFFYLLVPSKIALISIGAGLLVLNLLFILYSVRSYRTLIIDNFFYFILYLCALEISPLLLLYKLIV